MSKVQSFRFDKEEKIECLMTTMLVVKTTSLSQARKLIEQGQGESIGLMFTESEVIEEGEVKYVKDK
jgi:hypothetical protein